MFTLEKRGLLEVFLTSPAGTNSVILPLRHIDDSSFPIIDWTLMSIHFWGEDPRGTWKLTVNNYNWQGKAIVIVDEVMLHGVKSPPQAVSTIPSTCSLECDPNKIYGVLEPANCDSCASLRMASTLNCIDKCPKGLTERNGYCYNATLSDTQCA